MLNLTDVFNSVESDCGYTLEQMNLIDIMSDDIMDLWIQFGDVDTLDFYHQAGQHWQENFTPTQTERVVENVVMNTFG